MSDRHVLLPKGIFVDEFHGRGQLSRNGATLSLPAVRVTRERYDDRAQWELSGYLPDGEDRVRSVLGESFEPLDLEVTTETGRHIRVPEFRLRHVRGMRVEGVADIIDIDVSPLDALPERQSVLVEFSPTDLARPEFHLTPSTSGEVKAEGDSLPPWNVVMAIGEAQFALRFAYETVGLSTLDGQLALSRPALQFILQDSQVSSDPNSLIVALESELNDFGRLLSFLTRQRVDWTRIVVESLGRVGPQRSFQRAERRRRVWSTERPRFLRALVVPGRMLPGDLAAMYGQLRASPCRDAVLLAVVFLVGTLTNDWIEQSVMDAFTALETIVYAENELEGRQFTLDESAFDNLKKELKKVIKSFGTANGLSTEARSDIYRKLDELRRPSIVDSMVRLAERYKVDPQRLWGYGSSIADVIPPAYGRRSTLAHSGRLIDPEATIEDYACVHAITEQIVFNMLGGQERWLDAGAYQHLRHFANLNEPITPTG